MGWDYPAMEVTPDYVRGFCWDAAMIRRRCENEKAERERDARQ